MQPNITVQAVADVCIRRLRRSTVTGKWFNLLRLRNCGAVSKLRRPFNRNG